MFTRCPSCRAAFSISDKQLEIAAGMVRCGMCEHVFDARLYLFDQPHDDMYETVDVELGDEQTSAIDLEFLDRELHGTHPHIPEDAKAPLPPVFNTDKQINQEKDQEEIVVPKIIADDVSNLDNEEASISALNWLTFMSIFLLVAVLAIQIVAASKLSLIPQQYHHTVCKLITCAIETPHNLNKIEVLNRSIYTHPSELQALMVTVTIINRADFAQPYPLIQLRFLNIAGEVIAARQFAANHYLKDKWLPGQLMEKDIPLSIKLEVHDVGEEVVSYDFDFL